MTKLGMLELFYIQFKNFFWEFQCFYYKRYNLYYISQRFLLLILAFTVYNVIFLNSTYVIVFITNETMSTYLVTLGYVTNFKMSCILT